MERFKNLSLRAKIVSSIGALALVLIVLLGALYAWQFFSKQSISQQQSKSMVDVAYSVSTSSGSTWYEAKVGGAFVAQTVLPKMSISGIARGGGKTYILAFANASSSGIYQYSGTKYAPIYSAPEILHSLSVSSDGDWASFSVYDSSTKTSKLEVLHLGDSTPVAIADGSSTAILGSGNALVVLFTQGKNIYASGYHGDSWTKPVTMYSAGTAFPLGTVIATDGSSLFGFIDPLTHSAQEWQVGNFNVPAAAPKAVYASKTMLLGLNQGMLFGISATFRPVGILSITNFSQATQSSLSMNSDNPGAIPNFITLLQP
jgi:hypothetical protein